MLSGLASAVMSPASRFSTPSLIGSVTAVRPLQEKFLGPTDRHGVQVWQPDCGTRTRPRWDCRRTLPALVDTRRCHSAEDICSACLCHQSTACPTRNVSPSNILSNRLAHSQGSSASVLPKGSLCSSFSQASDTTYRSRHYEPSARARRWQQSTDA